MPAGLAALTQQFHHNTLVEVDLVVGAAAGSDLSVAQGAEVLQLAREALSNAARHARAAHVTVTLERDNVRTRLAIADDGIGFDPARPTLAGHHGLANMGARAEGIGASFRAESSPGTGTRIILDMPHSTEPDERV